MILGAREENLSMRPGKIMIQFRGLPL